MQKFLELLSAQRPLLSDGAMGTVLHSRGVTFDACFDQLNLTDPALVGEVHHEYIDAGANIIQTNTFGANRYKLSRHGLWNTGGQGESSRCRNCPPYDRIECKTCPGRR